MGTVYSAVRDDAEYDKKVAIKLIHHEMASAALRRRFQHERQALASLEHPYITRLIDGGTSDDGVPYLVMEFVDGEPIDRYADRRRLSVTDRLRSAKPPRGCSAKSAKPFITRTKT